MICADFLAGANLEGGDAGTLLLALDRLFRLLPSPQQAAIPGVVSREFMTVPRPKRPDSGSIRNPIGELRQSILDVTSGAANPVAPRSGWKCTT